MTCNSINPKISCWYKRCDAAPE